MSQQATIDRRIAILEALDKMSARVSTLNVPVGSSLGFGTLAITVRACRSTPPEQTPENAVFLEILDRPPAEAPSVAFTGWMFSSSPAISALDHPVYDVRLVECSDEARMEPEAMATPGAPAYELPGNPPLPPPTPPERR